MSVLFLQVDTYVHLIFFGKLYSLSQCSWMEHEDVRIKNGLVDRVEIAEIENMHGMGRLRRPDSMHILYFCRRRRADIMHMLDFCHL